MIRDEDLSRALELFIRHDRSSEVGNGVTAGAMAEIVMLATQHQALLKALAWLAEKGVGLDRFGVHHVASTRTLARHDRTEQGIATAIIALHRRETGN